MAQLIDLGKLRFSFRGEWSATTQYEFNDAVKYGGNLYIYTNVNATTGFLPTDALYWTLALEGIDYRGEWVSSEPYVMSQVVLYGGKLYIAVADSTGKEPSEFPAFWSTFIDGIKYEGIYSDVYNYQPGDVVTYGGAAYIAKEITQGHDPSDSTYWDVFVQGVQFEGEYSETTEYQVGDIVAYDSSSWICTAQTTGNAPAIGSAYWFTLAPGTYPSMAGHSGDLLITDAVNAFWGDTVNKVYLTEEVGTTSEPNRATTKAYVDGMHTAMREPTGFNRAVPSSMGTVEFSLDGVSIHRMSHTDQYTYIASATNFAAGTPWETPIATDTVFMYPAPGEEFFTLWQAGQRYDVVTATAPINKAAGLNYFFFEQGVLTQHTTILGDYIMGLPYVFELNINQETGELIIFANERHGIQMDGVTHYYLHTTSGTRFRSGLGVAGISEGATTYTSTASGKIYDEDIFIDIPERTAIPHLYKITDDWYLSSADMTYALFSGGIAQYNRKISTNNYELAPIPEGKYSVNYFIATDCVVNPVMKIVGQYLFDTLAAARESAQTEPRDTSLTGLPAPEFLYMGAVVVNHLGEVQTLDNGGVYVDLRLVNISAGTNSSAAVQAIAEDTFFRNDATGFTATDVQAAIDEAHKYVTDRLTGVVNINTDPIFTGIPRFTNDPIFTHGLNVFASAAARDAAISSPVNGTMVYRTDTRVQEVYTGSKWDAIDPIHPFLLMGV